MMRAPLLLSCSIILFVSACTVAAGRKAPILKSGTLLSVSGVSAGAFMAVQHQVAFSESVQGVAAIAGGPYWCAGNSLTVAVSACMAHPDLIDLDALYAATGFAFAADSIDNPSFIENAAVYLLSGKRDTIVETGVVKKLQGYYEHYLGSSRSSRQIRTNYALPAEHSFPTAGYGNLCGFLGEPYINDCGDDVAGDLLQHIYKVASNRDLTPPSNVSNTTFEKNLVKLSTSQFLPSLVPEPKIISLNDVAYAYIPTRCHNSGSGCSIHVAYHGCTMTLSKIGQKFILYAGYLPWAESNNIIVLFPQAVESDVPVNPKGCFDWWGYSGANYATQDGPQMVTFTNMVQYLERKYIH